MSEARTANVVANDDGQIQCFMCFTTLGFEDVALLVRLVPGVAFQAWCDRCAFWLLAEATRAGAGEDLAYTF